MNAVIFDLGGVLVRYDHEATLAAITAVCQSAPNFHTQIPPDILQQLGAGEINGRQFHHYLVNNLGMTPDYDTFHSAFCRHIQRNEEALAYAAALAQQPAVKVGIVSNTNEAHAAWLHAHLPEFGQFHSVILSNEVGLLKPDPAIYEQALDELGVTGETAVFIDDILENVTGAQAAGLHAIHHQTWPQTRKAIETWLHTSSI